MSIKTSGSSVARAVLPNLEELYSTFSRLALARGVGEPISRLIDHLGEKATNDLVVVDGGSTTATLLLEVTTTASISTVVWREET